jgi:hypothetical protein
MPQLAALPAKDSTVNIWLMWMNLSLQEAANRWNHLPSQRQDPEAWATSVTLHEVNIWALCKVNAWDVRSWQAAVTEGIHRMTYPFCRLQVILPVDELLARIWRLDLIAQTQPAETV